MSYPEQAEAAVVLWRKLHLDGHAIYPLVPVPPHPGPQPPRWRWRARRRWRAARDYRQIAKAWNWGALYGANVSQIGDSVVIDIAGAERLLCEHYHTQTQDSVIS